MKVVLNGVDGMYYVIDKNGNSVSPARKLLVEAVADLKRLK